MPQQRTCFSYLLFVILSLFATVVWGDGTNDDPFHAFLEACTEGKIDSLNEILAIHPDWIHKRSDQGESCLHVAGILGQAQVTALVLEAGGDPNIRSTFHQGLRMHPLSWNIYHGHVENARLLLQGGANVNLDFDHMETQTPVTSLDIIEEILQKMSDGDPRVGQFKELKELLLEYGAQRMADLKDQEL